VDASPLRPCDHLSKYAVSQEILRERANFDYRRCDATKPEAGVLGPTRGDTPHCARQRIERRILDSLMHSDSATWM
jgi:hypothetical protein